MYKYRGFIPLWERISHEYEPLPFSLYPLPFLCNILEDKCQAEKILLKVLIFYKS